MTFKQKIQNIFFPLGSLQTIRVGYLKKFRIRLTENSLWSPLIGNWEPAMQKIMVNTVNKGDIAYDLGANNGLHGLLLASLVGEKGMVFNFEPFEDNIKEINENFSLNGLHNYRNIQAAVCDRVGVEVFSIGLHNKQGAISKADSNLVTTEVPAITLDSFINEGNPMPSFIKMDIEGAEGAALRGFSGNIEKCFPDMIIELHSPEQDKEVGKFLKFYNYKAFRFDPFAKLKFTAIKDMDKVYPDPDGIWGSLYCLSKHKELENYTFNK